MTESRDTGWFTSSYSGGANDQCVECRITGGSVSVRDSKHPAGGELRLDARAWRAFVAAHTG